MDPPLNPLPRQLLIGDEMDRNRKVSPLKAADDAVKIDTTGLTIDEVLKKITSYINL